MTIPAIVENHATLRQRLSDLEMRISVLKTKLGEAERERDARRKRRQPTRMVETIVAIIAGDLDKMTRYRAAMLSKLQAD
jgi:hypothetical protein